MYVLPPHSNNQLPPRNRSRSPDFERNEALRDSWAALKTQPDNFDAWIILLTQADQSNDLKLARDIYNRFLNKYPYCYGFWKKYADMERRHQNFSDALSVWERGILAIPLSIDLWLGFLSFMRELAPQSDRGIEKLRELYDRALSMAGYEFHSDRLWQDYIAWEEAQGEWRRVAEIYDRLIRIPTAMYKSHMERFEAIVNMCNPIDLVSEEELKDAFDVVRRKCDVGRAVSSMSMEKSQEGSQWGFTCQAPLSFIVLLGCYHNFWTALGLRFHLLFYSQCFSRCAQIDQIIIEEAVEVDAAAATDDSSDAKPKPVVRKTIHPEALPHFRTEILAQRYRWHKETEAMIIARMPFEEQIKRPYFHVKPLEAEQLKNWRLYLDFEIAEGNETRITVLFERCLIACAMYDQFWTKYARWAQKHRGSDAAREIYRRAQQHIPGNVRLALAFSAFEESLGTRKNTLSIYYKKSYIYR
ncbi:HAT repeat protein [Ancylostoma duodenale]|uniref:HAT repeat protein n=1 Tax=Ancylostoma duodenale TaxID=51022 RepID=A0A0C2GFW3_9BILA|nr:HAT repeat protein [Ancylostoma duodenale]